MHASDQEMSTSFCALQGTTGLAVDGLHCTAVVPGACYVMLGLFGLCCLLGAMPCCMQVADVAVVTVSAAWLRSVWQVRDSCGAASGSAGAVKASRQVLLERRLCAWNRMGGRGLQA